VASLVYIRGREEEKEIQMLMPHLVLRKKLESTKQRTDLVPRSEQLDTKRLSLNKKTLSPSPLPSEIVTLHRLGSSLSPAKTVKLFLFPLPESAVQQSNHRLNCHTTSPYNLD
jgi:hypothetical protein